MQYILSVIIPVYNCEKYIRRCVESIYDTARSDVEIILVDDGSTDTSLTECRKMQKEFKNILVLSGENCGVSHARNLGLQTASGEWIMFLDSDDYMEHSFLDEYYQWLNDCKADMIHFGVIRDYYDQNRLTGQRFDRVQMMNNICGNSAEFQLDISFLELFQNNVFDSSCCKFFRRRIIEAASLRFTEGMKVREDTDFVIRYVENLDRIKVLDRYWYHYCIHGDEKAYYKRPVALEDLSNLCRSFYNLMERKGLDDESIRDTLNRFFYQIFMCGVNHLAARRYGHGFQDLYCYLKSTQKYPEVLDIFEKTRYKKGFHAISVKLLRHKLYFVGAVLFKMRFYRV